MVLAAAAVLAAVAGVTAGVLSAARRDRPVQPVAAVSHAVPASVLPVHYRGYRLTTRQTFAGPSQSIVDLWITPTTWSFAVAVACQGPSSVSISTYVYGRFVGTGRCAPARVVRLVMAGQGRSAQRYWQGLGVRLGAPVAVTARLRMGADRATPASGPPTDAARATVGMYVPVRR